MDVTAVKNWLVLFSNRLLDEVELLNQLDTAIGDGDHGSNMAKGATAMLEVLNGEITDSATLLKGIAMALITKVGGASGPLYGSAFLAMASETDQMKMIRAGLDAIQKRGKAAVGEKTMVDMWDAFLNDPSMASLDNAVITITKLKATKGRASYLGDRSIDHMDPGSQSSYYLFESLLEG